MSTLIAVSYPDADSAERVKPFGGEVIQTSFSTGAEDHLRAALSEPAPA
jgi:uncharacterized membrane protein